MTFLMCRWVILVELYFLCYTVNIGNNFLKKSNQQRMTADWVQTHSRLTSPMRKHPVKPQARNFQYKSIGLEDLSTTSFIRTKSIIFINSLPYNVLFFGFNCPFARIELFSRIYFSINHYNVQHNFVVRTYDFIFRLL